MFWPVRWTSQQVSANEYENGGVSIMGLSFPFKLTCLPTHMTKTQAIKKWMYLSENLTLMVTANWIIKSLSDVCSFHNKPVRHEMIQSYWCSCSTKYILRRSCHVIWHHWLGAVIPLSRSLYRYIVDNWWRKVACCQTFSWFYEVKVRVPGQGK